MRNQNETTTIRDTLHFESTTYRVLHGRGNNTASFAEHLKFPERLAFAYAVWINCSQLKLKNQNQDNVHFEIAATWCSRKETIKLLPSRGTWNFKNKLLLHIHFWWILGNQNKTTRIRTLYILKILYTGCSTSNNTVSFAEHLKFRE